MQVHNTPRNAPRIYAHEMRSTKFKFPVQGRTWLGALKMINGGLPARDGRPGLDYACQKQDQTVGGNISVRTVGGVYAKDPAWRSGKGM